MSQCVQIVAPDIKKIIYLSHLSHETCQVLPVTCHQRQQPQLQTLPLVTPTLCTEGWFAKKEPKKNPQQFQNLRNHQKKI